MTIYAFVQQIYRLGRFLKLRWQNSKNAPIRALSLVENTINECCRKHKAAASTLKKAPHSCLLPVLNKVEKKQPRGASINSYKLTKRRGRKSPKTLGPVL